MRRIHRPPLGSPASGFLKKRQAAVDEAGPSADADSAWRRARKAAAMGAVLTALRDMARKRERCMFCEDSRGTDIDHFRPKRKYPGRAFDWLNLLFTCSGCNRAKGDRFPLDPGGDPLLIDPTADDPWDHLFFDSVTGFVTARFAEQGTPDPRGKATTEILPLGHEAVTEARLRARRNLSRAVERFLQQPENAEAELFQAIEDNDDLGLGQWFFLRDGQESAPFSQMKASHPETWRRLQRIVGS